MGRQVLPLPSLPTELFALLDLIRNPKDYAAKVTALQAAIDQHNAAVFAIAGSNDIDAARLNAKLDRDRAAEELKAAQTEAASLVSRAQELVKKVEGEATALKAGLDARAADIAMAEAQLAQARTQFEARVSSVSNALAEREQALALGRREHEKAVAALEERRAKLQAAIS